MRNPVFLEKIVAAVGLDSVARDGVSDLVEREVLESYVSIRGSGSGLGHCQLDQRAGGIAGQKDYIAALAVGVIEIEIPMAAAYTSCVGSRSERAVDDDGMGDISDHSKGHVGVRRHVEILVVLANLILGPLLSIHAVAARTAVHCGDNVLRGDWVAPPLGDTTNSPRIGKRHSNRAVEYHARRRARHLCADSRTGSAALAADDGLSRRRIDPGSGRRRRTAIGRQVIGAAGEIGGVIRANGVQLGL